MHIKQIYLNIKFNYKSKAERIRICKDVHLNNIIEIFDLFIIIRNATFRDVLLNKWIINGI